jgi:mannosyltransferase OCH1-like enzyme
MSCTFSMGKTLIFLFGRLVKIFAHVIKFLSYVFHFFFPKKRFRLPKHSAPLFKSRIKNPIPRTLWQTNYTDRITLPLYVNYLFNRLLSPTFEYRFMITEDRAKFIKATYSEEVFRRYSKIKIGAAQADFWRVLVLQKHGGVYMDIDAHLIWFLNVILKPEDEELFITIRGGDVSNYFIASIPDNAYFDPMIDEIMENIEKNDFSDVWNTTGPGVFIRALAGKNVNKLRNCYVCLQGNFTNEYFQYIDKKEGKWIHAQKTESAS